MVPTIGQQIKSLRRRFADTIIPVLPLDSFVKEQANLMLATMDWLLDTHEHQYRYEVIENVEYRNLLGKLINDAEAITAEKAIVDSARELLSEAGPAPTEAIIPLRSIIAQNKRLKELVERIYETVTTDTDTDIAKRAKKQLVEVAVLQERRECAFYRMTGFPTDAGELGAVLADYAEPPK
jgi:hypothetical protein